MNLVAAMETSYDRFSNDPAYVAANRAFVARLPLAKVRHILDLACGSGAVGQLLMAAAPEADYLGIDQDPVQIDLAARNFERLGYAVAATPSAGRGVGLKVGSTIELALPDAAYDCVTIANAIHLMGDKPALLRSVARVLLPGGLFAFSSGFYAGCWPPTTQQVYYEWLKEATAWIAARSAERVAAGEPPIKRVRGKARVAGVAFQNRWLTVDEWRELLAAEGLQVQDVHERALTFDARSLAAIGAYSGMAEAQLSGYPLDIATKALVATAATTLARSGVDSVQHHWLELRALRR